MGTKRVAFCTFGCRLNQYDTESLRALLEAGQRYETVPLREAADVYVVNTCSVTARADASARKAIRRIHAEHPQAKVVVTGCYAQRAPGEVAEIDGVSLVLGAADRARIADEVEALRGRNSRQARLKVSPIEEAKTFLEVPIAEMADRSRAFVKVQEGCNESCSFCIIPQTRGRSRSRDPARILAQVRALVEAGHAEIVATGVHLGDYGLDLQGGRRRLAELIAMILEVPGLGRFRLSSIEPASISDEIVELMASEPKFAPHLHIPFQSGNDEILARMRRRYTAGAFRDLVQSIVERIPDCGIGSDVICGFPGESDAHFQDTFDCLESLPVSYIHPFTYSPRPGSEAAAFGDHIAGQVKKRRTRALKRLSSEKNHAAREAVLGRVVTVIPESGSQADGGPPLTGWTGNYLRVRFPAPANENPGRSVSGLMRVRVLENGPGALLGELV